MKKKQPDLEWDENYIEYLDEHFDKIFETMFEDFIERLFKNDRNFENRQEFIETIEGNQMEKAKEAAEKIAQAARDRFRLWTPKVNEEDELKKMREGPFTHFFDPDSLRLELKYFMDQHKESTKMITNVN